MRHEREIAPKSINHGIGVILLGENGSDSLNCADVVNRTLGTLHDEVKDNCFGRYAGLRDFALNQ